MVSRINFSWDRSRSSTPERIVAGITGAIVRLRAYRRHHRWEDRARHFGLMSACFRRGYGGEPVPGTVGRHLLACTIPCGGGALGGLNLLLAAS